MVSVQKRHSRSNTLSNLVYMFCFFDPIREAVGLFVTSRSCRRLPILRGAVLMVSSIFALGMWGKSITSVAGLEAMDFGELLQDPALLARLEAVPSVAENLDEGRRGLPGTEQQVQTAPLLVLRKCSTEERYATRRSKRNGTPCGSCTRRIKVSCTSPPLLLPRVGEDVYRVSEAPMPTAASPKTHSYLGSCSCLMSESHS